MRDKKQSNLAISMIAISLVLCHSAESQIVAVRGIGLNSCGSLTSAFEAYPKSSVIDYGGNEFTSESGVYESWILGFITAFDMANGAIIRNEKIQTANHLPDSEALIQWVRKYCKAKPTDRVSDATWAFLHEEIKVLESQ